MSEPGICEGGIYEVILEFLRVMQFNSGLSSFISSSSFFLLEVAVDLNICMRGKTQNFGSSVEQLSICSLALS